MPSELKFSAFISYASRDRSLGETFHRALERYRIPKNLRGRPSPLGPVGASIGPVFRDRTDLSAHESLQGALHDALCASQYLIVLCSPASAASRWVNEEIRTFRQLGRETCIIPVLVEGRSDPFDAETAPNGAFPPALFEHMAEEVVEPFAPDLRPSAERGGGDGLEMAMLKVIARMLSLPLDELKQRHREAERTKRRVRRAVGSAMAVLLVAAGVGGWASWQQSKAANTRLTLAIDTAQRQMQAAIGYRNRHGVPASLLEELFDQADADLSSLLSEANSAPMIKLNQARLALSLADFSHVSGDVGRRRTLLEDAERLLDEIETEAPPLGVRLGWLPDVSPRALSFERIGVLQEWAREHLRAGDPQAAMETSAAALALTEAQADDDAFWTRERADAFCEHGDILYRAGRDDAALEARQSCVALRRALAGTGADPADDVRLVAALSQEATLLRALGDVQASLTAQAEAAERATALYAGPDSDLRHASVFYLAHLWHADALNAARGAPEAEHAALQTAVALARDMTQADPGRMDWQANLAIALERSAAFTTRHLCRPLFSDKLTALATAEKALDEAVLIQDRRVTRDPDDTGRLRDLSVVLEAKAVLLADHAGLVPGGVTDRLDRAQALLDQVSDLHEKRLALSGGSDVVAQHDLALSQLKRARVGTLQGASFETSDALFAAAEDTLLGLRDAPAVPAVLSEELAALSFARAQHFAAHGYMPEAEEALQKAIRLLETRQAETGQAALYEADLRLLRSYDLSVPPADPATC